MIGRTARLLNGFGRDFSRLYAGLALGTDVVWRAPLPAGAKIIAANHPATTDPFMMMGLAGEPIHILITNMCFEMPALGHFLHGAGHIPVVAANGRAALDTALELLARGETVGIFPEGALSPLGGGACPAHTGVARLAIASGAPVIPLGIALDRGHITFVEAHGGGQVETARLYLTGPYAVTGGAALRFDGDLEDRTRVRAAADQIMANIMRLANLSALRLRAGHTSAQVLPLAPSFGSA